MTTNTIQKPIEVTFYVARSAKVEFHQEVTHEVFDLTLRLMAEALGGISGDLHLQATWTPEGIHVDGSGSDPSMAIASLRTHRAPGAGPVFVEGDTLLWVEEEGEMVV